MRGYYGLNVIHMSGRATPYVNDRAHTSVYILGIHDLPRPTSITSSFPFEEPLITCRYFVTRMFLSNIIVRLEKLIAMIQSHAL